MAHSFPWLPLGVELPDGAKTGRLVSEGQGYQILENQGHSGFVFLASIESEAANQLQELGPDPAHCERVGVMGFGDQEYLAHTFSNELRPLPVADIPKQPSPLSATDLLALAEALRELRDKTPKARWADALYFPEYCSCVSVGDSEEREDRRALIVSLLTGGIEDADLSVSQICAINRWITAEEVESFFEILGLGRQIKRKSHDRRTRAPNEFSLAGRPALEELFREYVIDHFWRKDKYEALGVKSPGSILLYGPPGTGKSFAVKKLADFLGWPVFEIDMGRVGSPYIHQTSVALHKQFALASEKAPSLVLIDEVDAFLGDRNLVGQDHKVEEISEFLRLMETASEHGVIVIATTNRVEAIDDAFKRRGRFDHIVEVGYPAHDEIVSVLEGLLSERPHVGGLNMDTIAEKLSGRPMSDLSWIVNEAARIAVKSGKEQIDDICLMQAISKLS